MDPDHNKKLEEVALQVWNKNELLVYFELLIFPGMTAQEILEFNQDLLPEKKRSHSDKVKSKLSVTAYLATRQNLNKTLNALLKNGSITKSGEKHFPVDELLTFKNYQVILKRWRKDEPLPLVKSWVNMINDYSAKKTYFFMVIVQLMQPFIEVIADLMSIDLPTLSLEEQKSEKIQKARKQLRVLQEAMVDYHFMENTVKAQMTAKELEEQQNKAFPGSTT